MRPLCGGPRPERITPAFLATWKDRGATEIVVSLDDKTAADWTGTSRLINDAGLDVWAWVEVARDESLADAHPEWMAAIGAHHDDWRRRFPDAPKAAKDQVVKAWPWVPIGSNRRSRLSGNEWVSCSIAFRRIVAGSSSTICKRALPCAAVATTNADGPLDYGTPVTTKHRPGGDAAAAFLRAIAERHPNKAIVALWVTECETSDLPEAKPSTGLCGGVGCARGDCWPRYARQWGPLVQEARGPIALALWSETFQRDPDRWPSTALSLFLAAPRSGAVVPRERALAVVPTWG